MRLKPKLLLLLGTALLSIIAVASMLATSGPARPERIVRRDVDLPADLSAGQQECLEPMIAYSIGRTDESSVPLACMALRNGQATQGSCALTPARGPYVRLSVVVAVMNRFDQLAKSLPTWLAVKGIDEVVIVDWSSDAILGSQFSALKDPRVRILRVEGQTSFIMTWAYNTAFHLTRGAFILKVDADTLLEADFLTAHPLAQRVMYRGNARAARDDNEGFLSGITMFSRDVLHKSHGYDERIVTYGYEEVDFYARCKALGYILADIDYDYAAHIKAAAPSHNAARNYRLLLDELENQHLLNFVQPWHQVQGEGSFTCNLQSSSACTCIAPFAFPPTFIESVTPRQYNEALLPAFAQYAERLIAEKPRDIIVVTLSQSSLKQRLEMLALATIAAQKTGRFLVLAWDLHGACKAPVEDVLNLRLVLPVDSIMVNKTSYFRKFSGKDYPSDNFWSRAHNITIPALLSSTKVISIDDAFFDPSDFPAAQVDSLVAKFTAATFSTSMCPMNGTNNRNAPTRAPSDQVKGRATPSYLANLPTVDTPAPVLPPNIKLVKTLNLAKFPDLKLPNPEGDNKKRYIDPPAPAPTNAQVKAAKRAASNAGMNQEIVRSENGPGFRVVPKSKKIKDEA